jgi:hypothetical protein
MQAQTVQLRVTLPAQLQAFLQTKASRFGLNMSAYVKNLIINDVKNVDYPVYQASQATEKAYKEAKKAEKDNTLIKVGDLKKFLEPV